MLRSATTASLRTDLPRQEVSTRRFGTTCRECTGTVPEATRMLVECVRTFSLKSLLVPVRVWEAEHRVYLLDPLAIF